MNGFEAIGRWLVAAGIGLVLAGGAIWLLGRFGGLRDIPGTLRINLPGATCIIPLLASIVISVVLTLVLNLVIRLINR